MTAAEQAVSTALTCFVVIVTIVLAALGAFDWIRAAAARRVRLHRAQLRARRFPGDLCALYGELPVIVIHADCDALYGSSTAFHAVHGAVTDEQPCCFERIP